jgi:hypothetical protein
VDEAGFYVLPMVVRTYALRGHTPVLRVKLTHDHLSAIGGITKTGRIFLQMQERAYKAEDVVRFLRLLLRKISGKLLVVWDGSPIHRADVIKAFLASQAGKRVHLERLPGYAPRVESARTGVEPAQAPRTQEPVLSGSGSPAAGAGACQGTPSPSANHPSAQFRVCS